MSTAETPLLEPEQDAPGTEAPAEAPTPPPGLDPADEPSPSGPAAAAGNAEEPTAAGVPTWLGLDRRLVAGAAAVVLVLVLFFGALLGKARHDLQALRGELSALRAEVQRTQTIQDRGAVLRMRAELQSLRQTLPPALLSDVEAADAALRRIDQQLQALP